MTIETFFPADAEAIAKLTPEQLTAFEVWMVRLDAEHVRLGSPCGAKPMAQNTGLECWLRPFLDGDEPEDALAEDLDNADYE